MSEAIEALALAVRDRRLVLFCGAGVSTLPPSRAPSWWEIYAETARVLGDRLGERFPELKPLLDLKRLLAQLTTQQCADLVATRFAGPTFSKLLATVDVADVNENHRAIAGLAATRGLRAVLTTNFDTLLERAAVVRGARFRVVAPGTSLDANADADFVIVKLHGTTVDATHLIETSTHKARELSASLRPAWVPALRGSALLVLGFSGADLNFGAAQAFFADVITARVLIYWLHLPGAAPILPPTISARTTLVEGTLPDFLRSLRDAVGEDDFATPITGRDAGVVLRSALTDWSRALHIGPWAAATFFLSLCDESGEDDAAAPLREALLRLAKETADRFAPGESLGLEDVAHGLFLGAAGPSALRHCQFEDAKTISRAAVNNYETMHQLLDGVESSQTERRSNLSSAWANFSLVHILGGRQDLGVAALPKALRYGYLSGNAANFLSGLYLALTHVFGMHDIGRSMRLAEGGVRVADRLGIVQSSIELRLLLGAYCLARNEIWSARCWLREARPRAQAVGRADAVFETEVLLGCCAVRGGQLDEGLAAIARAAENFPRGAAVVSIGFESASQYLNTLGIPQPNRFSIELRASDVEAHAKRIKNQRDEAQATGAQPWSGNPYAVGRSPDLEDDIHRALYVLGVREFNDNSEGATRLGVELAEHLLRRGQCVDALYASRNVIERVDVNSSDLARALAASAVANARLGFTTRAREHFEAAARALVAAKQSMPCELAVDGMWHAIQSGDLLVAEAWAARLLEGAGTPELLPVLLDATTKVASWGAATASVARVLLDGLQKRGMALTVHEQPHPYMHIHAFVDRSWISNREVTRALQKADRALADGRPAEARDALDSLASLGELSESQGAMVLQLQVLSLAEELTSEHLDRACDELRSRYAESLKPQVLARIEGALVRSAVQGGDWKRAVKVLQRSAWVAELVDEPAARLGLQIWEAHESMMQGGSRPLSLRLEEVLVTARYFNIPEHELWAAASSAEAAEGDGASAAMKEYAAALRRSADSAAADLALASAVRRLRRTRALDRNHLARLYGDRAHWDLVKGHHAEAAARYKRVHRSFRVLGQIDDALLAMAGEARARGRAGDYEASVQIYERAIADASTGRHRSGLLRGLGVAHLRRGTEVADKVDLDLVEQAIAVLSQAVDAAPAESKDRAHARLALARALGEKGAQHAALEQFDRAAAELAHLASPAAKTLIEQREIASAGEWRWLSLGAEG